MTVKILPLRDVFLERKRQNVKWGEQNHDDGYWLGILGEEFGEACTEVITNAQRGMVDKLRAELIQVAAVAVAWVEAIDRREMPERPEPVGQCSCWDKTHPLSACPFRNDF